MRLSIPALRPLRYRDFRLLWTGLAVSLAGDGMWLVALAWQVIELDGGPVQLSLVATAYSIGLIGLMLPAGIIADRLPRRTVMLSADIIRAATVAVVAALSLSGVLELWHLALASGLVGVGEALFIPSYTALVPQLLPEEEILAANGLEGTVRPLAQQAIGPALGGLAVALLEPGLAIGMAAAAFLFSAGCLALMRVDSRPVRSAEEATSAFSDLREGVAYVRRTPWLWATLTFAFIAVFFFVGPFEVLTPFVITDQVGGGSAEYGILLATFGLGSAIRRPDDLVAAAATPLLDGDALGLGDRPSAARTVRLCNGALDPPGGRDRGGGHRGDRHRDLGDASSAPGPGRLARAGLEPRLLPLARAAARVDGARGAGGRGVRAHRRLRGGGRRLGRCGAGHVPARPAPPGRAFASP